MCNNQISEIMNPTVMSNLAGTLCSLRPPTPPWSASISAYQWLSEPVSSSSNISQPISGSAQPTSGCLLRLSLSVAPLISPPKAVSSQNWSVAPPTYLSLSKGPLISQPIRGSAFTSTCQWLFSYLSLSVALLLSAYHCLPLPQPSRGCPPPLWGCLFCLSLSVALTLFQPFSGSMPPPHAFLSHPGISLGSMPPPHVLHSLSLPGYKLIASP